MASGTGDIFQAGLRSSEVYNPANGRWAATTGSRQTVRTDDYFCCREIGLLSSGKVLLAGNYAKGGGRGRGAELFDPAACSPVPRPHGLRLPECGVYKRDCRERMSL